MPANFGVKLSAGWCPARRPSRLQHFKRHGVTPAADRDSVLRTSCAAAGAPLRFWHVKPAAAYTKALGGSKRQWSLVQQRKNDGATHLTRRR
jgi:hypothetical protein